MKQNDSGRDKIADATSPVLLAAIVVAVLAAIGCADDPVAALLGRIAISFTLVLFVADAAILIPGRRPWPVFLGMMGAGTVMIGFLVVAPFVCTSNILPVLGIILAPAAFVAGHAIGFVVEILKRMRRCRTGGTEHPPE